jgi:hypothetical protein
MGYKSAKRLSDVQVKRPDVPRFLNTVNMRIHDPRERRFGAKQAPPPQLVSSVNRTKFSYDAANQKEMLRHGTIDLKAQVAIDEEIRDHKVLRARDRDNHCNGDPDRRMFAQTYSVPVHERIVQVARKIKMPRPSIPKPIATPNYPQQYGQYADFDECKRKKKVSIKSSGGNFGVVMGMVGGPVTPTVRPTQRMTARPINTVGADVRMLDQSYNKPTTYDYKETDISEWIDDHRVKVKRVNWLREDPRTEENFKDDREHHNNYKLNTLSRKVRIADRELTRTGSLAIRRASSGNVSDGRWRQKGWQYGKVDHVAYRNVARKDTRKKDKVALNEPDLPVYVQYDDTKEIFNKARKKEEFIPKHRLHKHHVLARIDHSDTRAIHNKPESNRQARMKEKQRSIIWDNRTEAIVEHNEKVREKPRKRFNAVEARPMAQKKYNPEPDCMLYGDTIRAVKEKTRKKYPDLSHIIHGEPQYESAPIYQPMKQTSLPLSLRGKKYGQQ